MTLPAGCEVLAYGGWVYLTVRGGGMGEATGQYDAFHAKAIARRLNEEADRIIGVSAGPTLGHPKTIAAS